MKAQRTTILTHFGPLFVIALVGWTAFCFVNSGSLNLLPGMAVALILAYAGTLAALRTRTTTDLRATYPPARTTGSFPTLAVPRGTALPRYYSARDDMDIAAGD